METYYENVLLGSATIKDVLLDKKANIHEGMS
jgi:hypothetical protein